MISYIALISLTIHNIKVQSEFYLGKDESKGFKDIFCCTKLLIQNYSYELLFAIVYSNCSLMELSLYILIYLLATTFALAPQIINERNTFILWLSIAIALSISIRLPLLIGGELNLDIGAYINKIESPLSDQGFLGGTYILREFVFFYSMRALKIILNNNFLVFIVFDTIIFLLLYKGMTLIRKGFFPVLQISNTKYLFFAVLVFFPVIIGMHSLYRQLFSIILLILAIGLTINNKKIKGFFIFLLSIFSHNSSIIFITLIWALNGKLSYKYLAFAALIISPFAIAFVLNSSNPYLLRVGAQLEIGRVIEYIYLFIFCTTTLIIMTLEGLKRRKNEKFGIFILTLTLLTIIYLIAVYSLSSLSSQRIAFTVFLIVFLMIGYYLEESFKHKVIMRLIYLNISLLPLLYIY